MLNPDEDYVCPKCDSVYAGGVIPNEKGNTKCMGCGAVLTRDQWEPLRGFELPFCSEDP